MSIYFSTSNTHKYFGTHKRVSFLPSSSHQASSTTLPVNRSTKSTSQHAHPGGTSRETPPIFCFFGSPQSPSLTRLLATHQLSLPVSVPIVRAPPSQAPHRPHTRTLSPNLGRTIPPRPPLPGQGPKGSGSTAHCVKFAYLCNSAVQDGHVQDGLGTLAEASATCAVIRRSGL